MMLASARWDRSLAGQQRPDGNGTRSRLERATPPALAVTYDRPEACPTEPMTLEMGELQGLAQGSIWEVV